MISTFEEYQEQAATTANYPDRLDNKLGWIYPVLGLAEEAGEVAGKCAKIVRDNNWRYDMNKVYEIAKELGDVLWMVSAVCDEFGISLVDVARINIAKLQDRKERNVLSGSGDNR